MKRPGNEDIPRCSFCNKPQDAVRRLIASPGDQPRTYPEFSLGGPLMLGPIAIDYQLFWILGCGALMVILLTLFFNKTRANMMFCPTTKCRCSSGFKSSSSTELHGICFRLAFAALLVVARRVVFFSIFWVARFAFAISAPFPGRV